MSPSEPEYLQHILDEAVYLLQSSKEVSREQFLRDPTLRRAFVRSLEIIGEASKQVSAESRAQLPSLDWRGMAGMRDRLIHAYFGVDYELVWEVVRTKIPRLRDLLEGLLKSPE